MLNIQDISETIQMIRDDHFDIRTITLGINLLGCISEEAERTAARVYDKVTSTAQYLVSTGEDIERDRQQAHRCDAGQHAHAG